MSPTEAYESLTDEQLDALLTDPDMRGPGHRRLRQEQNRRQLDAPTPTPEPEPEPAPE